MQGFNISIAQFVTQVQGIRIVVTPQLIFDALHVPRVDFPDYPNCPRLQTVSKNKHSSLFYETPSQSDHQNTPRSSFAKFLRFLNMVMTFVLHPLSHYNSITIDFPSHFILSFIDVYRDMATRDKLIFPYAIRRIICHSSVPYLESAHFTVMGAISAASVRRSEAQLRPKQPRTEMATPSAYFAPSSSSVGGVTLEAVMAQLEHMDAQLDTLSTELYQVNTRVSRIARRQARMGGFTISPSPSLSLQASKDEDNDDGSSDDDEDEDASSFSDEEMIAS